MKIEIPFNKPYMTGNELVYIQQAVNSGKISGNGDFTQKCQSFFQNKYGFKKCLLTSSCTDALEMCALLLDIKPGDEVIMPSFTFVSTAIAFIRQGAEIVFVDSLPNHPNMDVSKIEALITKKTKLIVPVHYGGVACDMDSIMKLADKYNLYVVEDAAQAIDSYYKGQPLGSIGHLGAFSFHETKNLQSGEGGMLVINDSKFINRSEIIWEKGTNRAEYFRGEVNKYGWVDIGSSFLPSEVTAAFLWAQLENLQKIQSKRIELWNNYFEGLKLLSDDKLIDIPDIPTFSTNNAHIFYILLPSSEIRNQLVNNLKEKGILSVFHYQSLHQSKFYIDKYHGDELLNSDMFSSNLLRLPLFFELNEKEITKIVIIISDFLRSV